MNLSGAVFLLFHCKHRSVQRFDNEYTIVLALVTMPAALALALAPTLGLLVASFPKFIIMGCVLFYRSFKNTV